MEVNQEDDEKTEGGIVYKLIIVNKKITNWKERSKTQRAGRSLVRRGRSTLDCSEIEGGRLQG
jgi:hypothetical protein